MFEKYINKIKNNLFSYKDRFVKHISQFNSNKNFSIKKLYIYSLLFLIPLIILFIYLGKDHSSVSAYEVAINNENVGTYVLEKDLFTTVSKVQGVVLTEKKVSRGEINPVNKLMELINKKQSITASAYEIKIADYQERRLILSTEDEVKKVFQLFKDMYSTNKTFNEESIIDIKLAGNYSVEPLYETLPTMTVDQIIQIIRTGTDEKKIYKMLPGDNITLIAKKFSLSVENLLKVNPQIAGRESKLQIGEELNLIVPKPLLTVEVYKTAVYDEKIPFETKITSTDQEYKTYRKVIEAGEEGIAKVKANIVEENGAVNTSRTTVLERTVIREPKVQVALQGTLQVPPKKALGIFANPVYGLNISSKYGSRGGSFHYGIDIAKSIGTAVYASDGGVIAEVEYNRYASTGLMIRIDHENGYESRYLHLSAINVKEGERIYQGQRIGSVGNTGNSTGPHLHFEIYKNGSPINPSSVLKN